MNDILKQKLGLIDDLENTPSHEDLDYQRQVEQATEARATSEELRRNTRLTLISLWIAMGAMIAQAVQTIHDFYR